MKWGILGTGRIADIFADALSFTDSFPIEAVASRSPEKSRIFAFNHHVNRAYDSYEALVKDREIDVVYIATPMQCHYENIKLCFQYGKNVLCEKTVTVTAGQLEELKALAKEKRLFFMEAMWMKFHKAYREAKAWAENGRIGRVQMVRADMSKLLPYKADDRIFRKDLGGGALLDLGVYTISLANDFMDAEPRQVFSCYSPAPNGTDFVDSVILRYGYGSAVLNMGFGYYTPVSAIILGTDGRIEFGEHFHAANSVSMYDNNKNLIEHFEEPFAYNGYEDEIFETERCITDGQIESRIHPLNSSLSVLKIMDAIRKQWQENENFPSIASNDPGYQ